MRDMISIKVTIIDRVRTTVWVRVRIKRLSS